MAPTQHASANGVGKSALVTSTGKNEFSPAQGSRFGICIVPDDDAIPPGWARLLEHVRSLIKCVDKQGGGKTEITAAFIEDFRLLICCRSVKNPDWAVREIAGLAEYCELESRIHCAICGVGGKLYGQIEGGSDVKIRRLGKTDRRMVLCKLCAEEGL